MCPQVSIAIERLGSSPLSVSLSHRSLFFPTAKGDHSCSSSDPVCYASYLWIPPKEMLASRVEPFDQCLPNNRTPALGFKWSQQLWLVCLCKCPLTLFRCQFCWWGSKPCKSTCSKTNDDWSDQVCWQYVLYIHNFKSGESSCFNGLWYNDNCYPAPWCCRTLTNITSSMVQFLLTRVPPRFSPN